MKTLGIGFLALILSIFSESVAEEFQFQPAQTSLTSVFNQLAESLERTGRIEPYLRHIYTEHERIAEIYREKKGHEMAGFLPGYFDEAYVDSLCANWEKLNPNLKLERLARESGRLMKLAINGDNGKGSSLVHFFNWYQNEIYDDMTSGQSREVGFSDLKAFLLDLARQGDAGLLAATEDGLSAEEREAFAELISKPRFTKSDLGAVDQFYGGPYERLSEYGQRQLSGLVFAGQRGEDLAASASARYSVEMLEQYESLFGKLDDQLSQDLAEELKSWICGVVEELGICAVVEFELGIYERALRAN